MFSQVSPLLVTMEGFGERKADLQTSSINSHAKHAEDKQLDEMTQVLVRIKESYYGTIDIESLVDSALLGVLKSLDKDSRIEKGEPPSLDFVRGLEEEASVVESRLINPTMGYIKITFFGRRTGTHFQKALEVLKTESGDRVEGLLIDLRDNPGGHLQSAIEVIKQFVPKGEPFLVERTRAGDRPYVSDGEPTPQFPVVILINNSTASSAELVAATLRYICGTKVVGERSKGKGTIQEVIPLGRRTLILTVGEYLLPDGSKLNDVGVTPDLEVRGYEAQLQTAVSTLKSSAD